MEGNNTDTNTGNMKSVAEIMKIIESKVTNIPLLQRNYKWSMECASELAEDLWEHYASTLTQTEASREGNIFQLNMITIYNDEEKESMQIIDGQQRLITLKLFLVFLERERVNLNFAFERDLKINKRNGRRYFIDCCLRYEDIFNDGFAEKLNMSVDVRRLYDNFVSMIIPVSFRTVYTFYRNCINEAEGYEKKAASAKNLFKGGLNEEIKKCLNILIGSGEDNKDKDNVQTIAEKMKIDNKEADDIFELCQKFQNVFNIKKDGDDKNDITNEDDVSDDEIKVSKYANEFNIIWNGKIKELAKIIKVDEIISDEKKRELVKYIRNNVEMLYHETKSKPIDEFLNVNENKTRFVISDYIRAKMISDNPIDGKDKEEIEKNKKNRDDILEVFSSLANYLYNTQFNDIWNLVNQRYDDFERYPDINRLKVLFCDRYAGTSTKGYTFLTEMKTLEYYKKILESLANELGISSNTDSEENSYGKFANWNTYNAVNMLLECKKDYRFFSLFMPDDVQESRELSDVTARERFCFFEEAYKMAESSNNIWDISYFLESQLYTEKCEVKKSDNLPELTKKQAEEMDNDGYCGNEWIYIDRGSKNDDLHKCLCELISIIAKRESPK